MKNKWQNFLCQETDAVLRLAFSPPLSSLAFSKNHGKLLVISGVLKTLEASCDSFFRGEVIAVQTFVLIARTVTPLDVRRIQSQVYHNANKNDNWEERRNIFEQGGRQRISVLTRLWLIGPWPLPVTDPTQPSTLPWGQEGPMRHPVQLRRGQL